MLMTVAMIITVMLAKYLYNLWIGDEVIIPLQLSAWMAIYIALSSLSNLYANIINGFGEIKAPAHFGIDTGYHIHSTCCLVLQPVWRMRHFNCTECRMSVQLYYKWITMSYSDIRERL